MLSNWSGWQDLNLRPPAPHAGAIPGYATSRTLFSNKKHALQLLGYKYKILTYLPETCFKI